MKKWTIKLKAENEDEAITYLNFLLNSFKAADMLNQPLHHVFANDRKIGSQIICKSK